MWLKSHHWVEVPETVYERRREMRVRESRHTVMLFDRKYYDIDTGKYNTDKMPTLYSTSLADLFTDGWREDYSRHHSDYLYWNSRKSEEAWFVPKDNDFDEECRREDELKQAKIEEAKRALKEKMDQEDRERKAQKRREEREREEAQRRERESYIVAENKARLERELEESKARQCAYEKQLAEVEARIKAQQQLRAQIAHEQQYGSSLCNVRPNKWIVK